MKKQLPYITLVVIFVFGLSPLTAKIDVDLFGYYEFQMMGAKVKDQFLQLFSNKLRVDLKSSLSENISFGANFNYITYHGKTRWNILDFLPPKAIAEVPNGMEPFYVLPFANRYYLDNAYIKFSFKPFDLMVGKQQISLGTGYVWNPVDVFNVKDFLDPTYEQPGHNAVRMDIPLGSSYTLTALYAPEETWRNSAKLIRLKGRISHFDFSFIGIEKLWRFHDYTHFDLQQQNFPEIPEKRQLLGFATTGEIFEVGIWAEYAYNWMETTEDFYELVTGIDYTFDFQTYILIEYFRNTLGKINFEDYSLNDWMRMMTQEQKAICRDQIFTLIQHPVSDFITLELSGIYCISDRSLALGPALNYSLSDNVELYAYLNFSTGQEGTAYSKTMGSGGMLRVRVYF